MAKPEDTIIHDAPEIIYAESAATGINGKKGEAGKEKKKGVISRFRAYLFNRGTGKESRKEITDLNAAISAKPETSAKETRKLNEYLDAIESQLDKMDEQNKILLFHLQTVKENNETLLNQINILSKNNEQLFQQFQASRKREKVSKIIAVIASCLAIGFWVYRFVMIALGKG